ncbi:MAG: hypothetical protein QXL01_03355, partial [Thermoplasmatales archaeon]
MKESGRLGTKGIFGPLDEGGVSPHCEFKARRNPRSPEGSKGTIMSSLVNSGENQISAPLVSTIL